MTDRISEEKLGEILAGCEGVTPGPWRVDELRGAGLQILIQAIDFTVGKAVNKGPQMMARANGAHIARLDPTTVSSLVTELRELREALRPFARLLDDDAPHAWIQDIRVVTHPQLRPLVKAAKRALSGAKL
jgi:hypothetical protein